MPCEHAHIFMCGYPMGELFALLEKLEDLIILYGVPALEYDTCR